MTISRSDEPSRADEGLDGLSLIDVFTAIGEEKAALILVTGLGGALALSAALLMPRYFTASTLVMPPQQQQSSATNALAQLGALAGVAGNMVKSSDEMYVAFLKTRRLQDVLIDRFQLQARYDAKTKTAARKKLTERVSIASDKKTGLITIEVDDIDAAFAAQLANAHVDELRKLLGKLAVTDAQQRRVFFEQQVAKTKDNLNTAEAIFRRAQTESGLVLSQALAEGGIREGALIKAQIAALEVQLQTTQRFATESNVDVQRLSAQLNALRAQLSKLEDGVGMSEVNQNPKGLKAVQAFREVKVQEALLEVFIRQLEVARADESREAPLLQQVDIAMPPEKAVKPSRTSILTGGVGASFALGLMLAFWRWFIRQPDNEQARRAMDRFKKAWAIR